MSAAERNRAMRIAYGHARRRNYRLAERWREIAGTFEVVHARQERHLTRLLIEAGDVHPDQLALPADLPGPAEAP